MNKKIVKYSLILILSLSGLYASIYLIQSLLIERGLLEYVNSYDTTNIVNQKVIRCSYNIFNTDAAYVELEDDEYTGEDYGVYFYYLKNLFQIKNNDWTNNYIGAADPKNITFDELVTMVKEDCSQFQQSYLNYTGYEDLSEEEKSERYNEIAEKNLSWIYTRAETQAEKAADIREISYYDIKYLPVFQEIYGNIDEMSDEEVIALHDKIQEEGLNEKVKSEEKINKIREELYGLSIEQWDQIEARYGDWHDLSDEELIEWAAKIKTDYDSGTFVLIGEETN